MYLLEGRRAPDHNTISRFRTKVLRQSAAGQELLKQLIQMLIEAGLVDLKAVFIDGTKIEANANKYTFVWRGNVEKNLKKLQEKAEKYPKEELGMTDIPDPIGSQTLRKAFNRLKNRVEKEHLVFVYGKGTRKTELQRQYETVEEMLRHAAFYEEALRILGKDRNSFSKTDPDATFMHMKDDHMRNSQLKPGYNVQAASTSEYIVGIQVHSDRNDYFSLVPMLKQLTSSFPEYSIQRLVADAGYESEEGYHYLDTHGIQAFIKPSNHEYSKTRQYQREMEFRLAMRYDEEKDCYICKGGRELKHTEDKSIESKTGYISVKKVYQCENSQGCPYYGKCYKGKYGKKIQVADQFDAYRAQSEANIHSEEGILLRINRSIQAEGVFGITKQDMGYDRFLRRGMEGVRTEYLLLAFGFNLNKLHHRIQEGRLGKHLLIPKSMQETA
jgi:hypothetical protein